MVLEIIKGQKTIVGADGEYDLKQSEIPKLFLDLHEIRLSEQSDEKLQCPA